MTYFDHAATTPMRPRAAAAMSEALVQLGNPSSLHSSGRRARRALEESREDLAAAVGAHPSEVIFTSGGTESDNLAVKGIFWSRRAADPARRRILLSPAEHHAVLDPVEWLVRHEGAEITWLEVDREGRVHPEVLREALEQYAAETALVTVMWANNEVGAVNPVAELAALAAEYEIPLHTDAVQAVETLPVDFAASGAAALSLTGHKLGGPVGTGALLLSRKVACTPVLHGGGQEREVRSGTLDTAGVIALATALREAVDARPTHAVELAELRDELVAGIQQQVPDAVLNGPGLNEPSSGDFPARLPGNAHFAFPGCEGDSLLMLLDGEGVECSTGSACSAGVAEPSHVLRAMGLPDLAARGSLRFSLGHTTTREDVQAFLEVIGPVVERARPSKHSERGRGLRAGVPDSKTTPAEV